MSESLRGRLLIATPTLNDPNFRRTVVLICAHGDDGAEELWRTALEELGGQYALVARMPDDPSVN
jgi:putative AlgH/UPF0301 family transcriptional regulator